jgi:very-short-patch-repair endonuclease
MPSSKTKLPQALSEGEETFALQCRVHGLTPEREVQFLPGRQWRFDFAWRHLKLALEVEGGTKGGGRHNRHSGFEADARKYNAAALEGWRVLRFTTDMVKSGEAVNQVLVAIGSTEAI